MPTIDITADAAKGLDELNKFGTALDAYADRFIQLNKVTVQYNKNGQEVGSVIESQTKAFEKLTQVLDRAGTVTASYYSKNEAAARASADRIAAAQDRADAKAAAAKTKFYDDIDKARQKQVDAEQKASEKAAAQAKRDADDAIKQGGIFSGIAQRIGRTLTSSITSSIFGFFKSEIKDSIQAAKDFQVQISLIRTISQGPEQQSFGKTGRDIRSVSDTTGFDLKDTGKAFYDATSNQVAKGAATAPFVKQAADLARVTGSSLTDSVNLLSTAINSYGLSAGDAEKVSAIFFKTIDEGRVIASEMANTLGRLYPLADQVGVSMTEVNSVIAITTQKGVKTNDAITLMSNLLVKLEKPTAQTAEFFKSLGVESGEAAIQLYGFTGLIKKMVDAVNSGQVPVSAFFDEIRGRKQFAVFQQSIDQIDEFNKKLQNTGQVVSEYRNAQTIRAESPGDALAKEANKLSNVFKDELGQAILENLNIVNKWVGGVDGVRNALGGFQNAIIAAGVVLTGYTVISNIASASNVRLQNTLKSVGAGALAAAPYLVAAASAYVIYSASKDKLFGGGIKDNHFGVLDPKEIDGAIDALQRYNAAIAGVKPVPNPFEAIEKQKAAIDDTFKSALGLISQANIANNKFLQEAKDKAKEVGEAVKVSLAGFVDSTKKGISDLKKGISDATEEIKRSKKATESFGDRGQEALYNFRAKYANDDFGQQKILLTEQKISDLKKRASDEYAKGTEESIAEARKLYDLIISKEVEAEELRVEHRKKGFEADLLAHPERHEGPGGHIFTVDDAAVTSKVSQAVAEQAKFERDVVASKQKQIEQNQKLLVGANANLRSLEAAIKNYESVDAFNKDGKLKGDFKTQGKFDQSKLDSALNKSENEVRAAAGGDVNARFQLELLFFQRRAAIAKEARGQENADYLSSREATLSTEKDKYKKQLEDIKRDREELLGKQGNQEQGFLEGQKTLATFGKQVRDAGEGQFGDRKKFDEIDVAIQKYQAAIVKVQNSKIKGDSGTLITDPKAVKEAADAFEAAVKKISDVKNEFKRAGPLVATDSQGRTIDAGDAINSIRQQANESGETSEGLARGDQNQRIFSQQFDQNVAQPIQDLKAQFPQLTFEADKSIKSLNQSFKDLATGDGLKALKDKLTEIQALIPQAGPPAPPGASKGKQTSFNSSTDDGSDVVSYAAEGGIVGQFPGQPRGVDRYPIWAAAGERIISASTSAMYAPMLDAIMQRRAPRYMAEGGIVGRSGGTTNIGDINVTVNGATTNTETARVVGNRLERQLRQNNIRLERRSQ